MCVDNMDDSDTGQLLEEDIAAIGKEVSKECSYLSKHTDSIASSPIPVSAGSRFTTFWTSIVNSTLVGSKPLLLLCFVNFFMTFDIIMSRSGKTS